MSAELVFSSVFLVLDMTPHAHNLKEESFNLAQSSGDAVHTPLTVKQKGHGGGLSGGRGLAFAARKQEV